MSKYSGGIPGTPGIFIQLSEIGRFPHNGKPEDYGGKNRGQNQKVKEVNPEIDNNDEAAQWLRNHEQK